jgi:hypothetical protein
MRTVARLKELAGGRANAVTFSPDGRRVALTQYSEVLLYDASDLIDRERSHCAKLTAKELDALWPALAGSDPYVARGAFQALSSLAPDRALAFLKGRVRPVAGTTVRARIARLITELDNKRYTVRATAERELFMLGADAESGLRETLKRPPSLEQARRVSRILERLKDQPVSGETFRDLWAIELLERQATPGARDLLHVLTKGAAGAWVTEEAKASLRRLAR